MTARVEKIEKRIARLEAKLPKLKAAAEAPITKKQVEKHLKNWDEANVNAPAEMRPTEAATFEYLKECREWDFKYAIYQIAEAHEELEQAALLDAEDKAKAEAKEAKAQARVEAFEEMPKVLRDFEDQLRERFTESRLARWQALIERPWPKYNDYSDEANEISEAKSTDAAKIKKNAARDAQDLVLNLFNRVKAKCGKITDVNGLYLNEANWKEGTAINGTVKGTDGIARVSSIVAGGYNIQCLHVRVIVR